MAAIISLALGFLGGWPVRLAKGVLGFLLETIRTPVGAALVFGAVGLAVGDWRGGDRVEARHVAAAEQARIIAEARTEADREIARETDRGLAASRRTVAALLEEIRHVPIPAPRPGDACALDASGVLRIRPRSGP